MKLWIAGVCLLAVLQASSACYCDPEAYNNLEKLCMADFVIRVNVLSGLKTPCPVDSGCDGVDGCWPVTIRTVGRTNEPLGNGFNFVYSPMMCPWDAFDVEPGSYVIAGYFDDDGCMVVDSCLGVFLPWEVLRVDFGLRNDREAIAFLENNICTK